MIIKNLKKYLYAPDVPLRRVISDLYRKQTSICLVVGRNKKLQGIVTLSDLKKALFEGLSPSAPVSAVMNRDFTSAPAGTPLSRLRGLASRQTKFRTGILEKIPLLDSEGRLKGLYILPGTQASQLTVLVTGAAGYVGSHLCRKLLAKGYRVVGLDALMFGNDSIRELRKHKHFTLIKGSVSDIGTVIKALQGVDVVVHLAGIVGDPASSLHPLFTLEQNHFATKMFADVCKYYQISRFVFASSCSVYGASSGILTEQSKLNPVSLYAQSKKHSEQVLLKEADKEFHPVILRFGTLYGLSPRMRFDLVVNTMSAHAYFDKHITVDGGAQWRPLLHVEDAAGACVAAIEAPLHKVSGQIFNVGDTKENYRIEDIARAVQKNFPNSKITSLDSIKDRRDYRVSFAKINRQMGWRASRKLPEGIAEMARALRKGSFKRWRHKLHSNYLTLKSLVGGL